MLDSIGSAIDSATGALGGNAQAAKDVDAVFHIGDPLADPKTRAPANLSPKAHSSSNDQNQLGQDAPTEFVHFGRTHAALAPTFPQDKKSIGDAVMWRDALEREALLLHGSLRRAQSVFKEYDDSKGAVGDIMSAVNVLGGGGSSGPDLSRFDELASRITKAGGSINKDDGVDYPTLHQAGIDLHKARANYIDFVRKTGESYLKHDDGGGTPGGALSSVAGAVSNAAGSAISAIGGPVGKALTLVQSIIFKPYDIYLAMYLAVREEYEDAIENASYAMTIKSIRAKSVPTFEVWFPFPKPADAPEGDAGDDLSNAGDAAKKGDVAGAIAAAQKAADDAKKKVDKKIQDVKDFLSPEAPDPPTPGDDALGSIFASFTSGKLDKRLDDGTLRARKKLGPVLSEAIAKGVGVDSMPTWFTKPLEKIIEMEIGLLQLVYHRAMGAGPTMTFSQDSLNKLGQEWFFDTLIDLLVKTFSFLQDSPSGLGTIQGQKITKQAFIERGRDLVRDEFGKYLNPILQLAMTNMGDRLREAIEGAKDQAAQSQIAAAAGALGLGNSKKKAAESIGNAREKHCMTMELLLARLPEVTALLIRDTVLPVYDMVFDQLAGKAMGALGNAMSPVKNMVSSAKSTMDDVKDYKDRVNKLRKDTDDGQGGTKINQDTDFDALKNDLTTATPPAPGSASTASGDFPGGDRKFLCESKPIPADDIKKVENDQKVDAKIWPDPPKDDAGASSSTSTSTATT